MISTRDMTGTSNSEMGSAPSLWRKSPPQLLRFSPSHSAFPRYMESYAALWSIGFHMASSSSLDQRQSLWLQSYTSQGIRVVFTNESKQPHNE